MRLVTLLRLSVIGPVVLPALMILIPVSWMAAVGTVLTIGIMYYGAGYALFAAGFLWWLRRPRTATELDRAVVVAPVVGACCIAVSITLLDPGRGAEETGDVIAGLIFYTFVATVIGIVYAAAIRLLGEVLHLRESGSAG